MKTLGTFYRSNCLKKTDRIRDVSIIKKTNKQKTPEFVFITLGNYEKINIFRRRGNNIKYP